MDIKIREKKKYNTAVHGWFIVLRQFKEPANKVVGFETWKSKIKAHNPKGNRSFSAREGKITVRSSLRHKMCD